MDAAVTRLGAEGFDVRDEDVALLSPLKPQPESAALWWRAGGSGWSSAGNAAVGGGVVAGHRRHRHPVGEREVAALERREQVEVRAEFRR
ncbi:hypothetical protein [Streptomyces triticiradicis]|uniref:hypothetical protein n=1 Tax=Streptomyces triticiradicis TaxID=2651189 RepID=UPI00298D94DE|nr:hypothetical protein [Streptomyces triticiradicis]